MIASGNSVTACWDENQNGKLYIGREYCKTSLWASFSDQIPIYASRSHLDMCNADAHPTSGRAVYVYIRNAGTLYEPTGCAWYWAMQWQYIRQTHGIVHYGRGNKKTQAEAEDACYYGFKTSLVSIHSQEQDDYLFDECERLTKTNQCWIGLVYDGNAENSGKWLDGTPFDFGTSGGVAHAAWGANPSYGYRWQGQDDPYYTGGRCVGFDYYGGNGGWYAWDCDSKLYFVCNPPDGLWWSSLDGSSSSNDAQRMEKSAHEGDALDTHDHDGNGNGNGIGFEMIIVCVAVVVALALSVGALFCYRRRHSNAKKDEIAEIEEKDVVPELVEDASVTNTQMEMVEMEKVDA